MVPVIARALPAAILIFFAAGSLLLHWYLQRLIRARQRAQEEAGAVDGEVVVGSGVEDGGRADEHHPYGEEVDYDTNGPPLVLGRPAVPYNEPVVAVAADPAAPAGASPLTRRSGVHSTQEVHVVGRLGPHGEMIAPADMSPVSSQLSFSSHASVPYGEAAYLPQPVTLTSPDATSPTAAENGMGAVKEKNERRM